ncbi:hypothetical protein [Butyricicoccus sp.]|uniref:hypothetical protein n=1 Tax=Butyricicoccus sp. TaxID=2049021 RepID=UPI003F17274D
MNIRKGEQAARDLLDIDPITLERCRRLKINPEVYAAYQRAKKKKRAQRNGNSN